ncbi:hypothetical protein JOC78_000596 [Bacillus ectoiniformans]|uniref:hypothetical protein n=1 Tax=Bacillus ectoiniformans TaxID=1494429 RepID=UPI00195F1156|nr:hypothetical protein [Bacillus ectoiniformans]MBM7647675.1 hypothetical protein [Bacillus ectoiniformans]
MSKNRTKENKKPENGSMASDFEEMKQLGKQMENQRTNEELKDDERQPDPVQYKERDKDID